MSAQIHATELSFSHGVERLLVNVSLTVGPVSGSDSSAQMGAASRRCWGYWLVDSPQRLVR
ncbi:MAG: hypothetical protein R2706_14790 [Acidimicrobiales bacterium]